MKFLAPLEFLLVVFLLFLIFKIFKSLLNSKKVAAEIDQVVHPVIDEDDILVRVELAKGQSIEQVAKSTAELVRRQAKLERLKRGYGG